MPAFKSPVYAIELYQPGAVDATRLQVTFTARNGDMAIVGSGEITFTTGARSCTCTDFAIGNIVCLHMRARERAFRRFAREFRLKVPEPARPLWAEDTKG